MYRKFFIYLALGDLLSAMLVAILFSLNAPDALFVLLGSSAGLISLTFAKMKLGKRIDYLTLYGIAIANLAFVYLLALIPFSVLVGGFVVLLYLEREASKTGQDVVETFEKVK